MNGKRFTFSTRYRAIAEKVAELYGEGTAFEYYDALAGFALNGEEWDFDESDDTLAEIWDRTKVMVLKQESADDRAQRGIEELIRSRKTAGNRKLDDLSEEEQRRAVAMFEAGEEYNDIKKEFGLRSVGQVTEKTLTELRGELRRKELAGNPELLDMLCEYSGCSREEWVRNIPLISHSLEELEKVFEWDRGDDLSLHSYNFMKDYCELRGDYWLDLDDLIGVLLHLKRQKAAVS